MGIIVAILLLLTLIAIFILSLYLNSKTPKPEGLSQISDKCESCQVGCIHNPNFKKKEKSEDCEL